MTAFGSHTDEKHHEYSEETEAHHCGYGENQDYGVHESFLESLGAKLVGRATIADFSVIPMISALEVIGFAESRRRRACGVPPNDWDRLISAPTAERGGNECRKIGRQSPRPSTSA
jgi:hypothetical protein